MMLHKYGLVGSTEWGEDFPEWISEHVVAYVNMGECHSRIKCAILFNFP